MRKIKDNVIIGIISKDTQNIIVYSNLSIEDFGFCYYSEDNNNNNYDNNKKDTG